MSAECIECGDEFNPRRLALGFYTCLECGEKEATKETLRKARCTAPAYNKGAYMYVSSARMAKEIGK
jgi:ribosomal protein L37AE/L43A